MAKVKRNSKTSFHTYYENCIPDREKRDQLRNNRHDIDGNIYKESKKQKRTMADMREQQQQMPGQISLM